MLAWSLSGFYYNTFINIQEKGWIEWFIRQRWIINSNGVKKAFLWFRVRGGRKFINKIKLLSFSFLSNLPLLLLTQILFSLFHLHQHFMLYSQKKNWFSWWKKNFYLLIKIFLIARDGISSKLQSHTLAICNSVVCIYYIKWILILFLSHVSTCHNVVRHQFYYDLNVHSLSFYNWTCAQIDN